MPNILTARNFDLTPKVRNYVEGKVDRLRRMFGNIQKIEVILSAGKHNAMADLVVQATQGTLKCAAKDESALAAFDLAMDKMDRQLERHKAKLQGNKMHLKEASRRARGRGGEDHGGDFAGALQIKELDLDSETPHRQPVSLRRLSLSEALDSFERAGYDPMAFMDEMSGRVSFLYRDDHGDNRLIEVVGEK